MTEDEATCLVLGLAAALERQDKAAWAALYYGGPAAVSDRQLLMAALWVIRDLAAEEGEDENPMVGAEDVLRRWALVAADDSG